MTQAALALAFAAGMVASFNPCGFSLLPAYLAMFVAGDRVDERLESRILRAVGVAAAVSVGFITVFASAGIILDRLATGARTQLPWVTIAVGVLLVVAGFASMAGWKPNIGVASPQVGGRSGGFRSMVGYGITYAIASLTCTLGPFLAVTGAALNQSTIGGIATYVSYALGMGTIILTISLGAALARTGLTNKFRFISRHAGRLGGGLMVLSGFYAIWYGRWELAVYSGDLDTDQVVRTGEDVRLWFVSGVDQVGASRLALVVASVAAVAVVVGRGSRRLPRTDSSSMTSELDGVE